MDQESPKARRKRFENLLRNRGNAEEAEVPFIELLFDLIYVFAVTQLSHYLLHHLTFLGLVQSIVLWFGIWLLWQHTIWVTNWFKPDTTPIRLMLFVLMVVTLFMTSALPEAFGEKATFFALCYVGMQIGRTVLVLFLVGNNHPLSKNYKRMFVWLSFSGAFWIAGIFVESDYRLWLWLIAVLIDYISPMIRFYTPGLGYSHSATEWTIDGGLLLERCKLFVIIAFGETVLMTGVTLSELDVWTFSHVVAALTSFLGSLVMWLIYFDSSSSIATMQIRKSKNPGALGLVYNSIHVVLIGAIILCAVGDEMAVKHPDGSVEGMIFVVMVLGPILYMAANAVLKWTTCRTFYRSHIIALMLLLLLIPLSFILDTLVTNMLVLSIFILTAVYEATMRKSRKLKQQAQKPEK